MTVLALIIDDLGLGGAQRQLVELVRGLPRERYRVHVISLSTRKVDYVATLQGLGIEPTLIDQAGKWSWGVFRKLWRELRRIRPQVVHTWLFTADLYGRLAAWLAGVPRVVCAVRSVEPWKPKHYIWVDRLLRLITHAYIVNAAEIGRVIARRDWVSTAKISTVYNGLDLERLDRRQAQPRLHGLLGLPSAVPLVGVVGRLAKEKNQALLVRAAGYVVKQHPRVHFVAVGNGPELEALQALACELGVSEHMHWVSAQRDIASVYASLSIVVVTSFYEGCCNVLLEAMAMGCPVVATAVGGNPEFIEHGRTGYLVPSDDADALASILLELLGDEAKRAAVGEAACAYARSRFALEHLVSATEAVYQKILSRISG
jgi:glycosyltransferase involved in cell wall biosynthesis